MALTYSQFLQVLERDQEKLARGEAPDGVLTCPDCGVPLMESLTGNRPMGDGTHLCSDCYFERWGQEIDVYPISAPRRVRGG